jgi:hypothetical protein
MSTVAAHISVDGVMGSHVWLIVPKKGPWFADVDLHDDAPQLTERKKVILKIGDTSLVGTIRNAGVFADEKKVRIVAGADGWGQTVKAKPYHNDAGVKAAGVIGDVAAEVKETIGTNSKVTLKAHYAREAGVAGDIINATAASWWVGFDGVTQIADRSVIQPSPDDYTVLDFDGRNSIATIDVGSVGILQPGMRIRSRLNQDEIIASLEYDISPESLRCIAWCGNGENSAFGDALRAVIQKVVSESLFGVYRYRVVTVGSDERVDLQAVVKNALPDLSSVPIWPSGYGMHSKPDLGSECLVTFMDGDRSQPAIIAFAPGSGANAAVARQGDGIEAIPTPMVVSGTMIVSGVPTPFTAVATWTVPKILGVITGGSGKAKQE